MFQDVTLGFEWETLKSLSAVINGQFSDSKTVSKECLINAGWNYYKMQMWQKAEEKDITRGWFKVFFI